MDGKRRLLSLTEARTRLGVSQHIVRQAIRRGQLPSVRLGGRLFVPAQAVNAALTGGTLGRNGQRETDAS